MPSLRVWLKAGHTVEIIRRMLPEFTAKTGIRVDLSVVAEGAAHDVLVSATARPDVVTAPFWYLPELVHRGVVLPLPESAQDFDALFSPLALRALTLDDALYALPHTLTGGVLSYRADLLEQVGVPVPQTLDEVIAAHYALSQSGHGGLVARCNPEFSSLETFAGWAAARRRTLLSDSGAPDRSALIEGVSDLVSALRSAGSELSEMDYAAVGERIVQQRAAMLFDTSAWAFRFEDADSPVRGRMGYRVIGAEAPAQFLYAEGLAVTAWCDQPDAVTEFLRWRHSEPVLRAEVEQVGRIDIPRLDMREHNWFGAYVRAHRLEDCLQAIDASWANGSLDHVARRVDFVPRARELMEAISGTVAGTFGSLAEAYELTIAPRTHPA